MEIVNLINPHHHTCIVPIHIVHVCTRTSMNMISLFLHGGMDMHEQ